MIHASRFSFLTLLALAGIGCGWIGLEPFNTGGGAPSLVVQPSDELVFDARPPGTGSSEASVTLQSATSAAVIVESVEIQGENAGAFSLGNRWTGRQLRPGEELIVALGFQPPNIGNFTAELVIVGGNTGGSVSLDLRGVGCPDQNTDNLCDNNAPQGPPADSGMSGNGSTGQADTGFDE
jgi:hypothetical protein